MDTLNSRKYAQSSNGRQAMITNDNEHLLFNKHFDNEGPKLRVGQF